MFRARASTNGDRAAIRGAERSRLHTELPEKASHPPVDAHNPPKQVQSDGRIYRFGPFELDASRKTLVRGAERVDVSIRGLDVLLVLVAHPGEPVSKETLFATRVARPRRDR